MVLQCNNYEIVDLGVMVPAEKILRTAKEGVIPPILGEALLDGMKIVKGAAAGTSDIPNRSIRC